MNADSYPFTIIAGRYAEDWLAFATEPAHVDPRILAGDNDWMEWGDATDRNTYGVGSTPDEALADLIARRNATPIDTAATEHRVVPAIHVAVDPAPGGYYTGFSAGLAAGESRR